MLMGCGVGVVLMWCWWGVVGGEIDRGDAELAQRLEPGGAVGVGGEGDRGPAHRKRPVGRRSDTADQPRRSRAATPTPSCGFPIAPAI